MPAPEPTTYAAAVTELAGALHSMWHACEADGANLPEALSYALALAARRLVCETEMDGTAGDDQVVDHELATGVLVSQRPGSWEATHVRGLTFPLDLLPPADDRPTG